MAVAVATALFAAGCSSGGSGGHASADHGFSIEALATSMTAARTAHVRMTAYNGRPGKPGVTTTTGKGTESFGTSTGLLDFTHRVAAIHEQTEDGPYDTIFAGDASYVRLFRSRKLPIPPRAAAGKSWLRYRSGSPANAVGALGLNPYSELSNLKQRGLTIKDLGSTRIGGQVVHHYSAVEIRKRGVTPHIRTFRVLYDLYVDSHERLVRMVTTSDLGQSNEFSFQFDYSQYGAPVDVAVPSRADVVDYSDPSFPTPRLQGAWTNVVSGRNSSFSWTLFRAPADHDRICWSFEPKPALAPLKGPKGTILAIPVPSRAAGGETAKPPRHNGHLAVCTRTGVWQTEIEAIAVGTIGTRTVVVAVVRNDVVSVTSSGFSFPVSGVTTPSLPAGLFGGPLRPIPIDPRFGGFVDWRSSDQSAYELVMKDGTRHSCDVGFLSIEPYFSVSACDVLANLPSAPQVAKPIDP